MLNISSVGDTRFQEITITEKSADNTIYPTWNYKNKCVCIKIFCSVTLKSFFTAMPHKNLFRFHIELFNKRFIKKFFLSFFDTKNLLQKDSTDGAIYTKTIVKHLYF